MIEINKDTNVKKAQKKSRSANNEFASGFIYCMLLNDINLLSKHSQV